MRWFFILTIMIISYTCVYASDERIAILAEGQEEVVKTKDAKIAIKMWLKEIATKDYKGELDISYYEYKKDAMKDFFDAKIQFLSLSSLVYLQERDKIEQLVKKKYSFIAPKEDYVSYVLVVPKMKNIKSLKALKNKKISMQNGEAFKQFYIDNLLLENNFPEHQKFFTEVARYKSHSKSLLKLFFGKVDSSIIPRHVWDMMCEMNPQINKKLVILHESPKIFVPSMVLIHKSMDPKLIDLHTLNAKNIDNIARGDQILTLLKADRYIPIDNDFLSPMVEYYEKYQKLRVKK